MQIVIELPLKILQSVEPYREELLIEAEVTYGTGADFDKELGELLINFEDNIIREEFAEVMKSGVASEINSLRLNDLIKRRSDLKKKKQSLFKK